MPYNNVLMSGKIQLTQTLVPFQSCRVLNEVIVTEGPEPVGLNMGLGGRET